MIGYLRKYALEWTIAVCFVGYIYLILWLAS